MFDQIEEKPHIEQAQRVGTVEAAQMASRQKAVKVKLRSKISAMASLRKAALLKAGNAYYRQIYVSPDRSPEQRVRHKELLDEVFRRRADDSDPNKRHFIKNGNVVTKYRPFCDRPTSGQ